MIKSSHPTTIIHELLAKFIFTALLLIYSVRYLANVFGEMFLSGWETMFLYMQQWVWVINTSLILVALSPEGSLLTSSLRYVKYVYFSVEPFVLEVVRMICR